MSTACVECGSPLGPEVPLTRTICEDRIRVTIDEATCTGCGLSEQSWTALGQFFDRALDLIEGPPKGEGPEYEARLDESEGWVFAPI